MTFVLSLLIVPVLTAQAQCSITLKTNISGCYQNVGSKATVQVEVTWANAPAGENVIVTGPAGSVPTSRTITPGLINVDYGFNQTGPQTIVSPQVVAFEIPANGTAGLTVSARFSTTTSCSAISPSFGAPAACLPTACPSGSLGGTVFNDFNADGIKDSGETTGISSVSVTAIACDGTVYGTTTDAFGQYSLNIPPGNYPVRVEFSNLPSYAGMGTRNGADGRTTVQFINAADCSVDLGVLNSNDYCESNPRSFVSCFVNGNNTDIDPNTGQPFDAVGLDALVAFDYSYNGVKDATKLKALANAGEIGSIWGLAYNKYTKRLFGSAVLRRHVGLTSKGLGGIFVIDPSLPSSNVVSSWDVFTDMGVNVGTIGNNATRGLTGSGSPSQDPEAFTKIGTVGIGDLEISDDGNALFFTNLFDKTLRKIDITTYNTSGTTPGSGNVTSFAIPNPGCVGGVSRPWGLKVYKGKVYVGVVCDAFTSQNKSDLRAYVYAFNLSTNTWDANPVFDFPLTYPKGYPNIFSGTEITGWFPWSNDWNIKQSASNPNDKIHPEPILTDIEFDIDGSMVLAFGDRTGLQGGVQNYGPSDLSLVNTISGGDILRAYFGNGSYVLENNAKTGPSVGSSPDNNQGPGFGEFYNDNFIDSSDPNDIALSHAENVFGALALRPGSGEVVVTVLDPINRPQGGDFNDYYNSGGFRKLNNSTGLPTGAAQIYRTNAGDGATFSKATGLGDLEFGCSLPTYLEIGNRIWVDTDKDGIQGPCEKALAGVNVALYTVGGTFIASTTTDANGEYYFNNNPTSSTVAGTVSTTQIQPNTAYSVRFGTNGTTNQYNSGTGLLVTGNGSFSVTTAFSTAPMANTMNDSNAQLSGGFLSANVTTGAAGSVNHTIDAGFFCSPPITVASINPVKATCTGSTANNNAQILVSGITNSDKVFLVSVGGAIPSYTATGSQPVSNSTASFTGLANPITAAGQSYSLVLYNGPCCYTVVSTTLAQQTCLVCSLTATAIPTVCNTTTNQYSVSGTIGLTNNTSNGPVTISDGTTTTTVSIAANATTASYTLTGLASNGVSHTVTVSLAGCGSAVAEYMAPASCTVAASIIVTSATVCYGSSATLTASGCTGNVVWSNATTGNILVTPALTANTNYTATCITASSTTIAVGTVTVLPQPILSLSASSQTVTVGVPVSLSAVGCVGSVAWSTNASGSTISVTPINPSTIYTATCTTGPGCSTVASITVNTASSANLVVISGTVCYGSSATLTASGCSGTVTWSNSTTGVSLVTPALTQTTSYTATCTTSTGSVTTAVGTVTVLPQPVLSLQASSLTVTVGVPVSLSAVGCVGSVAWSTNASGATISVTPTNPTNVYTATCTTGPGCSTVASITVYTAPSANLVVISGTVCYGSSATLVALGCSGTVTWSNSTTGVSLVTPALTQTTNYTATCTTSTGSVTTAVGTVTVLPQPSLTLAASSLTVTVGVPVSLSAVGCVGSVAWSTNASGATISVTPTNPTNVYTATCTTGPGCSTVASITVYTAPSANLVVISGTVCYGSSATLVALGCSGTVTWSNSTTGVSLVTPALTQTTNYTAACTTSTGSVTTAVGTVTVLPQPILSLSASSLTVTVGVPVSLSAVGCVGSVAWSTNASGATISVTPTNPTTIYTATCTTGPGCSTVASITVNTAPSASLVVISGTVCYGSSATLVASGCSGTVTWSNSTTGVSLVTPALTQTTSYTATCTTSTGSVTTAVGTVTVLPLPILSLQASSQTVTVGNPVSLLAVGCVGSVVWSTNASGATISVTPTNPTNVYTATCTTGPGCSTVASITVYTAPSANLVVISGTVCYGSNTTLVSSGCSGTVTWSNSTTGTSLVTPALTQTTSYTATCTTSTGSVTTAVGTVTVLPQPILSLQASSQTVTVGVPVSLSAVGCVGSVVWSTNASGATISVTPTNPTTIYTATCTTGPGCSTVASITVNTASSANLVVISGTVCYGSSATLTASGCSGTVTWSNSTTGVSLVTPALTQTTNYTATCTTSTGSTITAVGTVTVLPQPVLSLQASSQTVTVGNPVSLSAVGCVGSVAWSTNASGATISVTPINPTNIYTATCTTGPGCSTVASITVYTAPSASLVVISGTVCYGSSTTLVSSGCSGTVVWSNSTTGTSLVTPALTQTTSYTATCTTSTGSVTTAVGTVTVLPRPVLSLAASSQTVTVGVPVSLSAVGCVGSVAWSTNASGSTISVTPTNPTNIYTATCTTGPGCSTVASITVNTAPSANLVVVSGTVCYGSNTTLVSSGCSGTVVWSNNTTGLSLVTPALTQTTSYTATCTTSTGSVTTAVGTVTVLPQPVLSLQASSLTVTVGVPVSLSAVGCVGSVAWSTNASGATISVTPTNPTTIYTATCTTGPGCSSTASVVVSVGQVPKLELSKVVSKSKAQLGEVISYTVTLVNNGGASASNVVIRDSISGSQVIVPGSVATSVGSFSLGSPVSRWTIASLPAGVTATLTFSASLTGEGIVYNTATLPGDTNTVCTTVPVKFCKGDMILLQLNAPAGYSTYQWLRNGTAIALATGSSYTATEVGEYSVWLNQGQCPLGSCCPVIIELDSVPAYTVMPQTPSCVGGQPRNDGRLTVMGLGKMVSQYRYVIAEGSSFTVVNPVTAVVPSDGVLASNLIGDRTYTVRIYNGLGCYRDFIVQLITNCSCPADVCVPVIVKKKWVVIR